MSKQKKNIKNREEAKEIYDYDLWKKREDAQQKKEAAEAKKLKHD